jgi:hypothetical protein
VAQVGDPTEVRAALEAVAQSSILGNEARFWALDALAFRDYSVGNYVQFPDTVDRMADVASARA